MKEQTLAKAVKAMPAPEGYRGQIIITAQAYKFGGNDHPHFSVTGEISTSAERSRGDAQVCGCIHNEALKAWPQIKPIIALHLANADNGEPMHAEANGYYWLAGAVGGLGEEHHGGSGTSGRNPDECLKILADHLRVDLAEAKRIAAEVAAAPDKKQAFRAYIEAQRDRWQAEAKAGLELIQALAQEAR